MAVQYTSIGIDVGTTTFHYMLSRITQEKNPGFRNGCPFRIEQVEILYQSPIFRTPYTDDHENILVQLVRKQIMSDMRRYGLETDSIETGAVIVTGQAAKKQNAESVINALSRLVGSMVSTIAGSRLESWLSARGAGMDRFSREHHGLHVHADIGGGTSNIAMIRNGEILDLASLWIGGQMLSDDDTAETMSISQAARALLQEMSPDWEKLPNKSLQTILAERAAQHLIQYLQTGQAPDILIDSPFRYPLNSPIQSISFSGGVGHLINRLRQNSIAVSPMKDLGIPMAHKIVEHLPPDWQWVPVPNAIRATVTGVGIYNIQMSGDTIYVSDPSLLPLRNIPVIRIPMASDEVLQEKLSEADAMYPSNTERLYYLEMANRPSYSFLDQICTTWANRWLQNPERMLLIAFNQDMAKLFGYRMESSLKNKQVNPRLLVLDGVDLGESTYLDIGSLLVGGVVPVSAKTLCFG